MNRIPTPWNAHVLEHKYESSDDESDDDGDEKGGGNAGYTQHCINEDDDPYGDKLLPRHAL